MRGVQGVQVYVKEEEVEESLLMLVFGIGTWPSTHISLAQASHIPTLMSKMWQDLILPWCETANIW